MPLLSPLGRPRRVGHDKAFLLLLYLYAKELMGWERVSATHSNFCFPCFFFLVSYRALYPYAFDDSCGFSMWLIGNGVNFGLLSTNFPFVSIGCDPSRVGEYGAV